MCLFMDLYFLHLWFPPHPHPHYFHQWKLSWKWYSSFKICFVHCFTRLPVVWCYTVSLRVLCKAFHISNTEVPVFYFNSLVKVCLGSMPPHQGWPFWRRKDPQKENARDLTGKVELEMLTSPGLWQIAMVKVLERNSVKLDHFYKILVTTNHFQFPKGRRNPKMQVKLKNWIPKKRLTFLSKHLLAD